MSERDEKLREILRRYNAYYHYDASVPDGQELNVDEALAAVAEEK